MVAAGVPSPRSDHARALALMALDMLEAMRSDAAVGHLGLDLRIGINSGPVVAGVIGRKRFLYDLWGDAVNTASRMESHGTPGRIQITHATYELLADEFVCEPRGTIVVKGKGEIETWYLVGPERTPNPVPSGAACPRMLYRRLTLAGVAIHSTQNAEEAPLQGRLFRWSDPRFDKRVQLIPRLAAWKKPSAEKTERRSPAMTAPMPAHSVICPTVHQP